MWRRASWGGGTLTQLEEKKISLEETHLTVQTGAISLSQMPFQPPTWPCSNLTLTLSQSRPLWSSSWLHILSYSNSIDGEWGTEGAHPHTPLLA